MPDKPRRARFQIHLSTAIVLMFVAGGLIWANVHKQKSTVYINKGQFYFEREYGWPAALFRTVRRKSTFESPNMALDSYSDTNYSLGALDVVIALLILSFIWYACEWIIRRRTLKKEA